MVKKILLYVRVPTIGGFGSAGRKEIRHCLQDSVMLILLEMLMQGRAQQGVGAHKT
jgi:hypothetical protein